MSLQKASQSSQCPHARRDRNDQTVSEAESEPERHRAMGTAEEARIHPQTGKLIPGDEETGADTGSEETEKVCPQALRTDDPPRRADSDRREGRTS